MRIWALSLALLACDSAPHPQVELGGARVRRVGPPMVRVYDAQRLPFVRVGQGSPRLFWGETELQLKPQNGGYSVIDASPEVGRTVLRVEVGGGARTFPVEWASTPSERPAIAPLVALREAGDAAGALLQLDSEVYEGEDAVWAGVERARVLLRLGRGEEAIEASIRTAELAEKAGLPGEAAARLRAAAHHARLQRRYADARHFLARAGVLAARVDDPVHTHRALATEARIAADEGRLRDAAEGLTRAVELAQRAGRPREAAILTQFLALREQALGHHAQALQRLREGSGSSHEANKAWAELRAMRACAIPRDYGRLVRTFQRLASANPKPHERADLHLTEAMAALWGGEVEVAAGALIRARKAHPNGGLEPRLTDLIEARLALLRDRPHEARAAFARVLERSLKELDTPLAAPIWQALHGLGSTHVALGDTEAAQARWAEALELVKTLGEGPEVTGARSGFFADRAEVAAALLRSSLASGDVERAFEAGESWRAPVLSGLQRSAAGLPAKPARRAQTEEARAAYWRATATAARARLRCEDVSYGALTACRAEAAAATERKRQAFEALARLTPTPPAASLAQLRAALGPGEAILSLVALPTETDCAPEWHAFWVDAEHTQHTRIRDLGEWARRIRAASHVHVVSGGYAEAVNLPLLYPDTSFGYLPWAGVLLGPRPRGKGGLVILDPRGDLPGAAAEVERLDWPRLQKGAATRAAVLEALERHPRWLHYSGHGSLGVSSPWEAWLLLADGKLSALDILAGAWPMRTVVLSGCETGAGQSLANHEQVGLAQAFVVAGSQSVIAPDRRVSDAEATRFTRLFYLAGGAERPAQALQQVSAAMRLVGDDAWLGWRLHGRP